MNSKNFLKAKLKVIDILISHLGIVKSEGVSVEDFFTELKKVK